MPQYLLIYRLECSGKVEQVFLLRSVEEYQKRAFRFRAVYFVSEGTAFPFLLICSFFLSTHSLPFPFFLFIFCFFLGLCRSEMQTCMTEKKIKKKKSTLMIIKHQHLEMFMTTYRLIFFIFTTLIVRATFHVFTFSLRNLRTYGWLTTSED